jgi:hypothetical protein
LLTVEIFHGEGPGRYMYRGVLFKKANPNSKHMYICHVCKIQVLDNDIINHSKGKKHAANMDGVKIIDYKKEQEENRKEYANRKKLVEQGCSKFNRAFKYSQSDFRRIQTGCRRTWAACSTWF